MERHFDRQEAKKFLLAREEKEKQQQEENRQKVLQHVISVLKKKFESSGVQVYVVGSVLRAYHFNTTSDIDIVVRNFKGDRFQLWAELEKLLQRNVEIIQFETCHFKEFVEKEGLKIV
jgi:predicted nucleotidyltransferase